ncbi:MAG: 50S ribosomal protein L35 [Dehalococcoidia bacterium]|nr:MAG: 50S ribosomal protein L35 [Dehalococcoidia bacterium]
MPKLKTHKGAKSRFKVTGTGKILRMKCGKSHFRRRKAPRTKRLYDGMVAVSSADVPRLRSLLPYS